MEFGAFHAAVYTTKPDAKEWDLGPARQAAGCKHTGDLCQTKNRDL